MIIGKLHIEDFPTCVYFYLKGSFRKELIQKCALFGGVNYKELSKQFGVPYQTLLNWKAGRRSMPIKALWKIQSTLQGDPIIPQLNENVTAYKMKAGKLITDPNLPVTFDERAITLLVHLMADGYAADGQMPSYCNYDPQVLEEMKSCFQMFGNVPVRIRGKKKGKEILIPTIVLKLIKKFFGEVRFGSHECRIPTVIQTAPLKAAAAAVRAFADDEATVLARCIRFYSINSAFLNDIRSLLINRFSMRNIPHGIPESSISPIRKSTGCSAFYFDITSKGLKPYQELIGFTHTKKRLKLALWVNRVLTSNWHHNPKGVTKGKILGELIKGPKTAKQLSEAVGVRKQVVSGYFLKKLAEEGVVTPIKEAKIRGNLWFMKSTDSN